MLNKGKSARQSRSLMTSGGKTKLTIALWLALISAGFILLNSSNTENKQNPPTPVPDNNFVTGAMDMGWDTSYNFISQLNLNSWHKYTAPVNLGWPGVPNDNYNTPPEVYGPDLIAKINLNKSHGFRSIMDRPKIQYLAFGQSSNYQCESESYLEDHDYWFYTYNVSPNNQYMFDDTDNSLFGQGIRVKHCQPDPMNNPSGQGYVVSGLKANREQSNRQWNWWQSDSAYAWYVMPKIRADANYVNNNANWDNPVCRVDIIDWNNNPVPEFPNGIVLYAKNFRLNTQSQYNGDYIDKFYFSINQDPTFIRIPAGQICPGDRKNFWDWTDTHIYTDYRVYWYGQCEMWIDYVKVENEPAHQLFSPDHLRDADIIAETNFALTGYDPANPRPNYFYIEEFEFNHTPCIKYVNSLIKEHSDNKTSFFPNYNEDIYKMHIPHCENVNLSSELIKKYLIDEAQLEGFVAIGYPLEGWRILPQVHLRVTSSTDIFSLIAN